MINLVTRKEWGAKPPTCATFLVESLIRGVAVHYTASAADEQDNHKNCAARVRGIQAFHMSPAAGGGEGPWCDIAYNFIVCRHGYIFRGRGWRKRSAAQGTNAGNDGYIAVCFLGNDREGRDDVTDKGRAAFMRVFRRMRKVHPRAKDIQPHSHFHATACPGNELRRFITKARNELS